MTPIAKVAGKIHCWRLEATEFAAQWDSGFGAFTFGGRWNPKGLAVVYATLDPATTILEKAVHAGLETMAMMHQTLTCFSIDAASTHLLDAEFFPNQHWLHPCEKSNAQQGFLVPYLEDSKKPFLLLPSVVSPHSWNLIFDPTVAAGKYRIIDQVKFSLDPRLE